jgi:hypothetical protein
MNNDEIKKFKQFSQKQESFDGEIVDTRQEKNQDKSSFQKVNTTETTIDICSLFSFFIFIFYF